MIKINYRGFTIEQTRNGFLCEFINCFARHAVADVERAIDKFISGQVLVEQLLKS